MYAYDQWTYEGIAFYAKLPTNGIRPAGSSAIYRLYNDRAEQNDSNHRFVSSRKEYVAMRSEGWRCEQSSTVRAAWPLAPVKPRAALGSGKGKIDAKCGLTLTCSHNAQGWVWLSPKRRFIRPSPSGEPQESYFHKEQTTQSRACPTNASDWGSLYSHNLTLFVRFIE